MKEDIEAIKLQEIYRQADAEGRKKMAYAAAQLLSVQKKLGNDEGSDNKEQGTMRKKQ
jgi:hypothetical protein